MDGMEWLLSARCCGTMVSLYFKRGAGDTVGGTCVAICHSCENLSELHLTTSIIHSRKSGLAFNDCLVRPSPGRHDENLMVEGARVSGTTAPQGHDAEAVTFLKGTIQWAGGTDYREQEDAVGFARSRFTKSLDLVPAQDGAVPWNDAEDGDPLPLKGQEATRTSGEYKPWMPSP